MAIDKEELRSKIVVEMKERLRMSELQLGEILRRAKEAPGAMESHSDTDKNLWGRQAGGQQAAIETMKQELASTEILAFSESVKATIGSLVAVSDERGERRYFLLPGGGGIIVGTEEGDVAVITPATPLGSALLGKGAGAPVRMGERTMMITKVA